MGIQVTLEGSGNEVLGSIEDPENILHGILPKIDDETYDCLRFVDPYGDTIFNRLQMAPLRADIRRLLAGVRNPKEVALLNRIDDLALKCEQAVHCFLKFYGD
jgi:hypothetical protein